MEEKSSSGSSDQESEAYRTLAMLDELETLLEDLEEQGFTGPYGSGSLPGEMRDRMEALGVRDVQQIRDRLRKLHAQVDQDDADLTITES